MKISFSMVTIVAVLFAVMPSKGFADGQACTNFYPVNGPFYSQAYAPAQAPKNRFLFVSYNVDLLTNASGVLNDLATTRELQNADFILFQEAAGQPGGPTNFVEPIAKALSMNYVFTPAMTLWQKDYGNAILSRWPILAVRKILLPPSDKENCNQRIALEAIVQVGNLQMVVSSVHLSTRFSDSVFGGDRMRAEQMRPAVASLAQQTQLPSFISGDLNSFTGSGRSAIDAMTAQYGFTNVRPQPGVTYPKWSFDLDHAYARGFNLVASGIASSASGSDHFPIWTVLDLK